MRIIGAGLSGLLAAIAFPKAHVIEARPYSPKPLHQALLRFRSDAVALHTGIEFKRVLVRKGIFENGRFVAPNIAIANRYALKVAGRLGDRSIWNIDPVERYIAPPDFHEQLLELVGDRIRWDSTAYPDGSPTISTIPLGDMLEVIDLDYPSLEFHRSPISVGRAEIPIAGEVYQTIYFPGPETHIYRASITGRTLIVEYISGPSSSNTQQSLIADAFSIPEIEDIKLEFTFQRFGKIAPVEDDGARRAAIAELTQEHQIFSLGRFATWRNILLDDVVHDISVIKRLLKADGYSRRSISVAAKPQNGE